MEDKLFAKPQEAHSKDRVRFNSTMEQALNDGIAMYECVE
jgi:hypothetical protein